MVSTTCRICGRLLTVPKSVERGIGPVCWSRLNLELVGEGRLGKGGTGLSKLGGLRGCNNPPPTAMTARARLRRENPGIR